MTNFTQKFLLSFCCLSLTLWYAQAQNTVLTSSGAPPAGANNVLIGPGNSYSSWSSALNNVFIGRLAGTSTSTGGNNTFLGTESGSNNTSGSKNVFVGFQTGLNNSDGSFNTFTGYEAGRNNTTTGNSFVGYQAGYTNTTGNENAYFGYRAGVFSTGSQNLFLGYEAGGGVRGRQYRQSKFFCWNSGRFQQYGWSSQFFLWLRSWLDEHYWRV